MKVSGAYVLPDETVDLKAFCQRQIHTLHNEKLGIGKIVAQRGSLQGLLIFGGSLFADSLVNWCCKGKCGAHAIGSVIKCMHGVEIVGQAVNVFFICAKTSASDLKHSL